ncbi:glycoside hydrolase family 35 protein [Microbacterium phyllosphaerae]
MPSFTIDERDFLRNGEPFRVLSGALHYFRVHPDQWAERIRAARLMGLNTIETYVAWNEHAPSPEVFDVSGRLDLGAFLDAVAAEGMHAIVRPGPYICAEFDNGGLPGWLTSVPGVALRSSDRAYLAPVEKFLRRTIEIVRPRQFDRGGPVILMQIENEYGAYGNDSSYLRRLVELHREHDITVPLTTVDQPHDAMLAAGGLPDVLRTASFGSHARDRLRTLRDHQPTGPLMCGEFWDGWFDSWGGIHHTTPVASAAGELDELLSAGASVNIYMFHGGTNFRLTNGANHKGRYVPISTTYDYDAPLDELGRPTEKYWAFRDVISRHFPVPELEPVEPEPLAGFDVTLTHGAPLRSLAVFGSPTTSVTGPPTFDEIAHYRGFLSYSADISGLGAGALEAAGVRDRAWVSVDGSRVGVLDRGDHERSLFVPAGDRLDLLVEDQGRVNYGMRIGEAKGLIGPVTLGGTAIGEWLVAPIELDRLPQISLPPIPHMAVGEAIVARGTFDLDRPVDLLLDTAQWGKGVVWVNGLLLGRYWRRGPQRTLFVPRPATLTGNNTITVLELEGTTPRTARFVGEPDLGPAEK